ncbi:uncharacterized protein LOC143596061 [Bidens hawaiensis]|uniref:uncharacterized protein LOC143596061 n=1 Tax=Bidens hawaiensis TaxID=980011 RepID=UPI00404A964E
MLPIVSFQNLLLYIDGSVPQPSSTITVENKFVPNPEVAQDRKAVIILNASLTEEVVSEVLGILGARNIWLALESAFCNSSVERMYSLRDTLRQLTKDGQIALVPLWARSLFSKPLGIKLAPLIRDLVTQAESHELFWQTIHGSSINNAPVAFAAQQSWDGGSQGRYNRSNQTRDSTNDRGGNSSNNHGRSFDKRPPKCQICQALGHYATTCPNLYKYAKRHSPPDEDLAKAFHAQCHVTDNTLDWNVDSRATAHMTPDFDFLHHSAPYHGITELHSGMVCLFLLPTRDRVTKRILAKRVCENGLCVLKETPQALVSTVANRAS